LLDCDIVVYVTLTYEALICGQTNCKVPNKILGKRYYTRADEKY